MEDLNKRMAIDLTDGAPNAPLEDLPEVDPEKGVMLSTGFTTNGVVLIRFGAPIAGFELSAAEAVSLARQLLHDAVNAGFEQRVELNIG